MSYEDDLRRYAELDWVVFGSWRRLHHAATLRPDPWEWRFVDVTTACGLAVPVAHIPGMFSRMGCPRCAHCCDALGWPRGVGSPKNDPALRPLVGLEEAK